MTKKLIMLLAMLATMSASAQVQFGAKVGVDLTNFWGKDVDHKMTLNYQVGLMMEYKFSRAFAVAPEVVFAAQGNGEITLHNAGWVGENINDAYITYHTNYINVPVMLKYYAMPALSIDFGPQVGFNVYSKYTVNSRDGNDDYKYVINNKKYTKAIDFGLGLGATYNMTDNAFVQARYTLGLTQVFKEDLYESKTGNIQLAFGIKF
jgi:hypothetical protein